MISWSRRAMVSMSSMRVVKSDRLLESSRISKVLTLPAVYRATSRCLNRSMVSCTSAWEASSFKVSWPMLSFKSWMFSRVVSCTREICSCSVSR